MSLLCGDCTLPELALLALALLAETHPSMTVYANYLPDEILLEVVAYIEAWDVRSKQSTLAKFSYVNRFVVFYYYLCLQ